MMKYQSLIFKIVIQNPVKDCNTEATCCLLSSGSKRQRKAVKWVKRHVTSFFIFVMD